MAGIFDEKTMMQAFEKSIPNEEALHAGVKGIIHAVNRKICFFDVYIGITQNYLIVVECEEQGAASSLLAAGIEKKTEDGAGICLPFSQVKSCVLQKGIMGSIRCSIALKSGYSIRLQMPKRAGLAGNMPHHLEYRDKILARLRALSGTQK